MSITFKGLGRYLFIPTYATVVQLVERLICNQYVTGSSPVGSSRVQMSDMMVD